MVEKTENTYVSIEVSDEEIEAELKAAFGTSNEKIPTDGAIAEKVGEYKPDTILRGRIVGVSGNEVIVDVGLKSEGYVPLNEWESPDDVKNGEEIEVLLEQIESDTGIVQLSKRKADRIRGWERILSSCDEGERVSGKCIRKIKGGLLVDIGVPVFLPASQVDRRRPGDVGEYIGQTIDAVVLKIDKERRNIVISRRKLIEQKRAEAKAKLMEILSEGDIVEGTVKNIADFGAFIDLGGIDGLLHITDMSWDRINHPSDLVKFDDKIKVKVLSIDKDKEKIALGLKQMTVEWSQRTAHERYQQGVEGEGPVMDRRVLIEELNHAAVTRSEIPVAIYLADELAQDEARSAVDEVLAAFALETIEDFPEETGSWFKRFIARFRRHTPEETADYFEEMVTKAVRAIELQQLHKSQAVVDREQAKAVAALIACIEEQEYATLHVGSILLVKTTSPVGRSQVIVRTLTQKELVFVEQHPEVLKSPQELFVCLTAGLNLIESSKKAGTSLLLENKEAV